MVTVDDLVRWARDLADELEADMRWHAAEAGFGGYWEADSPEAKSAISQDCP